MTDATMEILEGFVEMELLVQPLAWLMADDIVRSNEPGVLNFQDDEPGRMIPFLPLRRAAAWLMSRIAVDPTEYELRIRQGAARRYFSMARDVAVTTLEAIKGELSRAIEGGAGWEWFKGNADAVLDRVGAGPTNAAHAQLVHRNAYRTSTAQADEENRSRPDVARALAFLRWLVTGPDDRNRPTHLAMHLHTERVDAPVWRTWVEPAGHNCRCRRVSITYREAQRRGITASPPLPAYITDKQGRMVPLRPDPGFEGRGAR